jgi:hypothetical protein
LHSHPNPQRRTLPQVQHTHMLMLGTADVDVHPQCARFFNARFRVELLFKEGDTQIEGDTPVQAPQHGVGRVAALPSTPPPAGAVQRTQPVYLRELERAKEV